MGYTHYWTTANTDIPPAAIELITTLLEHGKRANIIESVGDQAFRISNKEIFFNGIGEDAHEPFLYNVGEGESFCKTARKPYDKYVCSTLIILRYYCGIEFSSDGGVQEGEWDDAIEFLLHFSEMKLFKLDQNLIDSLDNIRKGEQGDIDLFEDFPIFGPDLEDATGKVSFVFARFCSFSLERNKGESYKELKNRAQNHAKEIFAECKDTPICHYCSIPDLMD